MRLKMIFFLCVVAKEQGEDVDAGVGDKDGG